MIDQLQHRIAHLHCLTDDFEITEIIGVVSELIERVVDLERKVRNQSATINELVGRANE